MYMPPMHIIRLMNNERIIQRMGELVVEYANQVINEDPATNYHEARKQFALRELSDTELIGNRWAYHLAFWPVIEWLKPKDVTDSMMMEFLETRWDDLSGAKAGIYEN